MLINGVADHRAFGAQVIQAMVAGTSATLRAADCQTSMERTLHRAQTTQARAARSAAPEDRPGPSLASPVMKDRSIPSMANAAVESAPGRVRSDFYVPFGNKRTPASHGLIDRDPSQRTPILLQNGGLCSDEQMSLLVDAEARLLERLDNVPSSVAQPLGDTVDYPALVRARLAAGVRVFCGDDEQCSDDPNTLAHAQTRDDFNLFGNTIQFCEAGLSRSVQDVAATLLHEIVHLVDLEDLAYDFRVLASEETPFGGSKQFNTQVTVSEYTATYVENRWRGGTHCSASVTAGHYLRRLASDAYVAALDAGETDVDDPELRYSDAERLWTYAWDWLGGCFAWTAIVFLFFFLGLVSSMDSASGPTIPDGQDEELWRASTDMVWGNVTQ